MVFSKNRFAIVMLWSLLGAHGCSNSDDFKLERKDSTGADDGQWAGEGEGEGEGADWSDFPPKSSEGDQYEAVGTNPFVITAHDPFSTFAADVDSASYDIFRRDVSYGYLPNPASVRLEEFVNYFQYAYAAPAPTDEHPFSIGLSMAQGLFSRQTSLMRVAIQGMLPPAFEKKPANLVFLIDTSGSMNAHNKLPLVKRLLVRALDVLDPDDTVSIVTYAGSTRVALSPTAVRDKSAIQKAIESFSAGGSTAGAAGIDLAYQQAEEGFIQGGINHIILCSDGDFNVGPYSPEALVALIEQKRKTGVTLTVLGFGVGNLNDHMMEKLSNAGNGNYSVIASEKQADDYVENRLLSNLVLIAKDMKIQVEFNPEFVLAYRLLGYENRAVADEDFRNDTVDGGEVGAGHRVTALYEIVPMEAELPMIVGAPKISNGEPVPGTREVAPGDMALVKVRYKDVDANESDSAYEVRTGLSGQALGAVLSAADADFQWAVAVAAFAEILKSSPYAEPGTLEQIEAIVTEHSFVDNDREEFKTLFLTARDLLDQ